MTTRDDVIARYNEARQIPLDQRSDATDDVAALARELGDDDLIFAASSLQVTAHTHSTDPARALAPFAVMVRYLDAQPEWFGELQVHHALWDFKTILSVLREDPRFSRAQIESMLESMADHYRRLDAGPAGVALLRYRVTRALEGPAAAEPAFDHWRSLPRDDLSDCAGCEAEFLCWRLTELGRYAEAAAIARDAERYATDCTEQPQGLYATGLEALLQEGDIATAVDRHLRGVRMSLARRDDSANLATHIAVLARAGQPRRALELIEARRDVPADTPWSEAEWQATVALTMQALRDSGFTGTVTLPQGELTVDEALEFARRRCLDLAAQFDARNGNDAASREFRRDMAREPLPPLPLPLAAESSTWAPPTFAPMTPSDDPVADLAAVRDALAHGRVLEAHARCRGWARADVEPQGPQALAAAGVLDSTTAQQLAQFGGDLELARRLRARARERLEAAGSESDLVRFEVWEFSHALATEDSPERLRTLLERVETCDDAARAVCLEDLRDCAADREQYRAINDDIRVLRGDSLQVRLARAEADGRLALLDEDLSALDAAIARAESDAPGVVSDLLAMRCQLLRRTEAADGEGETLRRLWDLASADDQDVRRWVIAGHEIVGTQEDTLRDELLPAALECLDRLDRVGADQMVRGLATQIVRALMMAGRALEAIDLCERALAIDAHVLEPGQRVRYEADTINLQVYAANLTDQLGEVARAASHAQAAVDQAGEDWNLPYDFLWWLIARGARLDGRHADAADAAERAVEPALSAQDFRLASEASALAYDAAFDAHGYQAALELNERLATAGEEATAAEPELAQFWAGTRRFRRAVILGRAGLVDEAVPAWHEAIAYYLEHGNAASAVSCQLDLAELLARSGRDPEAVYTEALARTRAEAPRMLLETAQSYCRWLDGVGRVQEADALWEASGGNAQGQ